MRNVNQLRCKLLFCLILIYVFISFWRWNQIVVPIPGSIEHDSPLILYWDLPWGEDDLAPKHGEIQGRCVISRDKRDLMRAKAVVFHHTAISKWDLPWKHYRSAEQVFIWWTLESPGSFVFMKHNLENYNNFFNWTMTYRWDSDVTTPYNFKNAIYKQIENEPLGVDEIVANKAKLAIIFTSNCWYTYGASMRKKISDDIFNLGLNIERYGHCYSNSKLPRSSQQDVDGYIKKFKFYFAFENALHCRDYITEKFWNSLILGVVPVVWGTPKEDYEASAPPNSFIHVDDFETLQDLIAHLNYLDRNDTAYRAYFRWRESIDDEDTNNMNEMKYERHSSPESLCDTLIRRWDETQTITSLTQTFMASNPKECVRKPFGNFYVNKVLDFFGWR